jgi:hypothetical protein
MFSIPDHGSRVKKIPDPGSGSASETLSIFNPKKFFLAFGNIWDVHVPESDDIFRKIQSATEMVNLGAGGQLRDKRWQIATNMANSYRHFQFFTFGYANSGRSPLA